MDPNPCCSNKLNELYDDTETVKCDDSSPNSSLNSVVASTNSDEWDAHDFPPALADKVHLNSQFDWKNFLVGIVVRQDRRPSDQNLTGYQVWSFCSAENEPAEWHLETDKPLELGAWIKFKQYTSSIDMPEYGRSIFNMITDANEWSAVEAMFTTMPFADQIAIECQIIIPKRRSHPIITKWQRWIDEKERLARRINHIPFILKIVDHHKIITDEERGTDRWATLVYKNVHSSWNGLSGVWLLKFLRPKCYGDMIQQ